jgi:hypothetical protein
MSEYKVKVDEPEQQYSEEEESPPQRKQSNRRRHSEASKGSRLGDDRSERSSKSKGLTRSPSFVSAEFGEDKTREKAHLRDANAKLEDRLSGLRRQVEELRVEGLSRDQRQNMQDLEADNEVIRKEIEALREKVGAVSSVETLDNLTDELAAKEIDLKGVEVRVRNLYEENYANAKLIRDEDKQPNPQAVFLDLKNERRRFEKRLEKTRANRDKARESHEALTNRVKEFEDQEKSLGLHELTHEEIVGTQKKYEANEKELEKLRRKLSSFEGTFSVRQMQTVRKSQHLADDLTELQSQVRSLEAQVMKLEATIMSNQKLSQRPPHFIEPMTLTTPRALTMSASASGSANSPRQPAGSPPSNNPRQQQTKKAEPEPKKSEPSPPKKAKKTSSPRTPAKPAKEEKEAERSTNSDKGAPPPAADSKPAATKQQQQQAPPPKQQQDKQQQPKQQAAPPPPAAAAAPPPEKKKAETPEQQQLSDMDRSPTPQSPVRTPTPPAPKTPEKKAPTPPPSVDLSDLYGRDVVLRTQGGMYLRAHPGDESKVDVKTDDPREWERYVLTQGTGAAKGKFLIRTGHGTYLSARQDGTLTTSQQQGQSEHWTAVPAGKDRTDDSRPTVYLGSCYGSNIRASGGEATRVELGSGAPSVDELITLELAKAASTPPPAAPARARRDDDNDDGYSDDGFGDDTHQRGEDDEPTFLTD